MDDEIPQKNPWPLRMILLAILLVMLLALGWDWWASKRCDAAWLRVSDLHQEMIAKPGGAAYGPEEVRNAIGWRSRTGEPVAKDHYYEEIYQLRRGLPWQRYYLCVVYQKLDDRPIFYAAFQGRMPDSSEVPANPIKYEEFLKSAGSEAKQTESATPEPEKAGGEAELPDGEAGDVEPIDKGADAAESPEEESGNIEPAEDGTTN